MRCSLVWAAHICTWQTAILVSWQQLDLSGDPCGLDECPTCVGMIFRGWIRDESGMNPGTGDINTSQHESTRVNTSRSSRSRLLWLLLAGWTIPSRAFTAAGFVFAAWCEGHLRTADVADREIPWTPRTSSKVHKNITKITKKHRYLRISLVTGLGIWQTPSNFSDHQHLFKFVQTNCSQSGFLTTHFFDCDACGINPQVGIGDCRKFILHLRVQEHSGTFREHSGTMDLNDGFERNIHQLTGARPNTAVRLVLPCHWLQHLLCQFQSGVGTPRDFWLKAHRGTVGPGRSVIWIYVDLSMSALSPPYLQDISKTSPRHLPFRALALMVWTLDSEGLAHRSWSGRRKCLPSARPSATAKGQVWHRHRTSPSPSQSRPSYVSQFWHPTNIVKHRQTSKILKKCSKAMIVIMRFKLIQTDSNISWISHCFLMSVSVSLYLSSSKIFTISLRTSSQFTSSLHLHGKHETNWWLMSLLQVQLDLDFRNHGNYLNLSEPIWVSLNLSESIWIDSRINP